MLFLWKLSAQSIETVYGKTFKCMFVSDLWSKSINLMSYLSPIKREKSKIISTFILNKNLDAHTIIKIGVHNAWKKFTEIIFPVSVRNEIYHICQNFVHMLFHWKLSAQSKQTVYGETFKCTFVSDLWSKSTNLMTYSSPIKRKNERYLNTDNRGVKQIHWLKSLL